MDTKEYRARGIEIIDYICKYYDNISEYRVYPSVKPGYLTSLIPPEAPKKPDKWENIMKDLDTKIMPGITHWQHPRFHAYFPNGRSYASFLGDMVSDAIGCVGFTWAASPACTELETIVLDWLGKALSLPDFFFYFTPGSKGGGVIQGSASECILVSMIAARDNAVRYLKGENSEKEDNEYLCRLTAYTSEEAHSCVEKAARICMIKIRILSVDNEGALRGPTLADAIENDLKHGYHPFFVCASLGSTGVNGFDNLKEIGPIVAKLPQCWLHVDAAYAGSAFLCPELRYLKEGIELADSFNTNCNKFLNICFDCSCLWVRDRYKLLKAFIIDPVYLQFEQEGETVNYRNWQIPLSRRFRALKLWFTLRDYGIEKLQNYQRNHIQLAKQFEALVRTDDRFEVVNVVRLGLVCFRLKAKDEVNRQLLSNINSEGNIHMIPTLFHKRYLIRFCVVYQDAKQSDIEYAWNVIKHHAEELLKKPRPAVVGSATVEDHHRMSYTQAVPIDVFERLRARPRLRSEASLIYVPGDTTEEASSVSSPSIPSLLDD